MKYRTVVCGGTFDHLHAGHKTFLQEALRLSETVLLGLTSDSFAIQKDRTIESYQKRFLALKAYLQQEGVWKRVKIAKIYDEFIPQAFAPYEIEAIFVTADSQKGAEKINERRRTEQKTLLPIVVTELAKAEDGKPIASYRIRQGEINREGRLWIQPEWSQQPLFLPQALRQTLQEPFGTLFPPDILNLSVFDMDKVVTVGDVVTKMFHDKGYQQKFAVVDLRSKRRALYSSYHELGFQGDEKILQAKNPAGQLAPELFQAVNALFADIQSDLSHRALIVEGEEDLAVLPVLLRAPLGFRILYGQPNEGIVRIIASEEHKERAYHLVSQFTMK